MNNRIWKLLEEAYAVGAFAYLTTSKYMEIGSNIYDHEWDLIIILDACRVDAIQEVEEEYDFISNIQSEWSVGSTSKEWMANTFRDENKDMVGETTYISANGFSSDVLSRDPNWREWGATEGTWISHQEWVEPLLRRNVVNKGDLDSYHPIWDLSDRHNHGHTPYAEDVTDYAIQVGRLESPTKTIVHYMQPHAPYLGNRDNDQELEDWQRYPFQELRNGERKSKVWDEYMDNLRYVLDEVSRLLRNFSANDVVITSDHGELFGELGLYDHGVGIPHPSLKKVPWVETTAEDLSTSNPEVELDEKQNPNEVKERLRNLGYFE
ncbi:sulfatase-like hydrolase/transferase [Natrinema sp. H-ect1]|uniref:sulfatase-like hydrolase/transferase n=1 Tax=Natrinema sp. H-ect1 TaxID=3242700 RepID=UPI00359E0114